MTFKLIRRSIAYRGRYPVHIFQDCDFFQSRPVTGHSHAVSAQPDPATL